MATLEKFFCIFALLIASLMSLLLCAVLSTVPQHQVMTRPAQRDGLLQPPLDLAPRAPGAQSVAATRDGR
jgi:hypothetical protein